MKTPTQLVVEASDHLCIYLSRNDIEYLASKIPTVIPWDENGTEFVSGMVIGYDAYEQHPKLMGL